MLAAPAVNFTAELERMRLATSRFRAVSLPEGESSHASQSASGEAADLRSALKKAGTSAGQTEAICAAHGAARARVTEFLAEYSGWNDTREWTPNEDGLLSPRRPKSAPQFPNVALPGGLPAEFADYLAGALAWHDPSIQDKTTAREAWERLLDRPADQRRFKSVWAAFMLGKFWEEKDPDKALHCFQQVRDLARNHFVDSIGLATASLGLEARVQLNRKNYERALELYLEQFDAGDDTALDSLRLVAVAALDQDADVLRSLAANPRTQRVLTAFASSSRMPDNSSAPEEEADDAGLPPGMGQRADPRLAWLQAVEAAGVSDRDSAEKLSLAAYQAGDLARAERWVKRASGSPVAEWVHAKVLLRAGRLDPAAKLLERISASFPLEPLDTNEIARATLADDLVVPEMGVWRSAGRQLLGELGVLRLVRREYTESLDALLRGGHWLDAAYVAERVLTLDELKAYVDRAWPPLALEPPADPNGEPLTAPSEEQAGQSVRRQQIRHLLARRLTRSIRGDESRPYYPENWLPQFDALVEALRTGWDESASAPKRAESLFAAATLAREHGVDLIATEVQPDWAIYGGCDSGTLTWEDRASNAAAAKIVPAGREEIQRASHHTADPEQRYHYRYQAAFLAWEAARLMPNNSDDTARILCLAGSWLKNRDPQTADLFYKMLVRRNRLTELGSAADRRHWFPDVDDNGQLLSHEEPPELTIETISSDDGGKVVMSDTADVSEESETTPTGADPNPAESPRIYAYGYIIQPGDTFSAIAKNCAAAGLAISVQDLVAANPVAEPLRLRAGQKILIPNR